MLLHFKDLWHKMLLTDSVYEFDKPSIFRVGSLNQLMCWYRDINLTLNNVMGTPAFSFIARHVVSLNPSNHFSACFFNIFKFKKNELKFHFSLKRGMWSICQYQIHTSWQHSSNQMSRYIEIECASQIASLALDDLHCMFVVCMLS